MRISDALASQRPFFSFEFFPPKDDAGSRQLVAAIANVMEKLKTAKSMTLKNAPAVPTQLGK